ncbi:MAG TPA: GDP-mannose 4,6-dehydratase [Vicinamibacterales bacterium]|nr:GDP-mannose 4,6-dehydratase [Vicinamibacterales bacterium]
MAGPTIVTGATGFVGRHLLDRLADRAPLVAWHRPGGTPPDPNRHLDWRAVDLRDRDGVAAAIAETEPSQIFHVAGAPSVDTSWKNALPHLQANALGTHHLLEAVRTHHHECRVLVVSSAQIYQVSDEPIAETAPTVPPNPYGLSKLAEDQLALRAATEDGLDVVIARPFNHIGPGQSAAFAVSSFARQIARSEAQLAPPVLRVGNLDARRDITDVRDVVDAYDRVMTRGTAGRAYNISSGRAWRIGDLLEELCHLSTIAIRVEIDPEKMRPNDVPVVQGDATRIRAELGWVPQIRVEQTLHDTLDWWRAETRAGR